MMLCENCHERQASVILTQESMQGSTERHLCERCAFQGKMFHFDPNQEPLSIQQFLSHWFGGMEPFQTQQTRNNERHQEKACPNCGLTFRQFLEIGKFGCATCYEAFQEQLPQIFAKLHNGHVKHAGKIPVSFNEVYALQRRLDEIRKNMQVAIEQERFEEAATLRDEANALKRRLTEGGEGQDVN